MYWIRLSSCPDTTCFLCCLHPVQIKKTSSLVPIKMWPTFVIEVGCSSVYQSPCPIYSLSILIIILFWSNLILFPWYVASIKYILLLDNSPISTPTLFRLTPNIYIITLAKVVFLAHLASALNNVSEAQYFQDSISRLTFNNSGLTQPNEHENYIEDYEVYVSDQYCVVTLVVTPSLEVKNMICI